MRRAVRFWAGAALLACAGVGPAHAAEAETRAAPRLPGIGKRVTDQTLAARRGGTDTRSESTLQGTVSGNQAVNVTTGANAIGGGALAGAAGIPVVVQNTGNNVLIQTSVIVNLQLK